MALKQLSKRFVFLTDHLMLPNVQTVSASGRNLKQEAYAEGGGAAAKGLRFASYRPEADEFRLSLRAPGSRDTDD